MSTKETTPPPSSSSSPPSSQTKRMKLSTDTTTTTTSTSTTPNSTKLIATHSGTFQADEALGVWLLRRTKTYHNSPVVRTRDPTVYSTADIVLDVGGVYDHDAKRYDHHQRGYDERFSPRKEEKERCTALSASGLIYRHYGREVVRNAYPELTEENLEMVYVRMYDGFLETIDAVDTGVEMVDGPPGSKLRYGDSTGLSNRVGRLNPRWNEEDEDGGAASATPDERFEKASALCGEEFMNILVPIVESEMPARAIVERALLDRRSVDSSGEILLFPNGGLPWRRHLYDLERVHNLQEDDDASSSTSSSSPLVKFVLYTDQAGMYRVQAVTVEGQAFQNRLSLPEAWRGVRDDALTSIAGIKGCTFCHAAGFIGGNETYEGALEMARVALEMAKKK